MPKLLLITIACIGLFTFGPLASTPASAATAGWMVHGTNLTGTKALSTTAKTSHGWLFHVVQGGARCLGQIVKYGIPIIEAVKKAKGEFIEFSECSGEPPCSIAHPTIKTTPVSAEITLEGPLATVWTLSPQTKNTLTTIAFEGESCALAGTEPVTGKIKLLDPTGQDEETVQLTEAIVTEASGELKIGSSPAELTGDALLRLASGESWSFL